MGMRKLRRDYSYNGKTYTGYVYYRMAKTVSASIDKSGNIRGRVRFDADLPTLDKIVFRLLRMAESKPKPTQDGFTYVLGRKMPTSLDEAGVRQSYRSEALAYYTGRVRHFEGLMGIKRPYKVRVRDMSSRLGVNSSKTYSLTFSLYLYHFSPEVVDSVVVHELAHHFVPNHSKRFYDALLPYCPDYRRLRRSILDGDFAFGASHDQDREPR